MRAALACCLSAALVAAPAAARADWTGCFLGPSDLHRCAVSGTPAAALAAIAVPLLVAGAAVSVAHELDKRTEERAATTTDGDTPPPKKTRPTLALMPTPPDPYRVPSGRPETRAKPSGAFQFNETATNVATAVAGAAVLGAMIATVAKSAHK